MRNDMGGVFLARAGLVAALMAVGGCGARRERDIHTAIDAFHAAASAADLESYIDLMTPDGVFLGTDASERWDREEFRAFCEPYFQQGRGWTYVPERRHLSVSGDVAWFDEILTNEAYGTLRGSGVLQRGSGGWRIAQYNLAFLVPNEVAKEVVGRIRAHEEATSQPD